MPRIRKVGGRSALVAAAVVTVVACGAGWAVSTQGGAAGDGVSVHTATPATRDELIRKWGRLLADHGQQLPDTSELSTAEIESEWQQALIRYADAAEDDMSVADPCTGLRELFDPGCW